MRCNIIDPSLLTDQHLIAERRELRMIPPLFQTRLSKYNITGVARGIPKTYRLGTGHMLFWMNKGEYLAQRYEQLTVEMENRGFVPNRLLTYELSNEAKMVSTEYLPSRMDLNVILNRLIEKVNLKPNWYRYYGSKIMRDDYIKFLTTNAHNAIQE